MSVFTLGGTEISVQPYLSIQNLPVVSDFIAPTDAQFNMKHCCYDTFTHPSHLKKNIISCFKDGLWSDTWTTRQANLKIAHSGYSNLFVIKCLFCSLFIHFLLSILNQMGLKPVPADNSGSKATVIISSGVMPHIKTQELKAPCLLQF